MIHVCYGLYDKDGRYSKFVGTSIVSMFENVSYPPLTVHILHDSTLTEDNRDKFSYIAGRYNQLIKFYNIEKICAEEIGEIKSLFENNPSAIERYSIASMFRLLIPKIFPAEMKKLIYLDADTVVNLDIGELWQMPLEDKTLAAVPESFNGNFSTSLIDVCKYGFIKNEEYFNSGVLLINLEKFNENGYEKMLAGAKFLAENNCVYLDQNILNYCFTNDFIRLPAKFNYHVRESRIYGNTQIDNRICHYLDATLQTDMRDNFNQLWFKYFVKTPYFNEEVLKHFDEGIRLLNITSRIFSAQLTAIVSGKQRAFFVHDANVNGIKKVFYVKDDEEIILAKDENSLNELLNSMRQANGTKVYFIGVGNYDFVRNILKEENFVENKDFLEGRLFLSEVHGIPLDTHFLVKAL